LPAQQQHSSFIIVEAFFYTTNSVFALVSADFIGVGIALRGRLWLLYKKKRDGYYGAAICQPTLRAIYRPTGHF